MNRFSVVYEKAIAADGTLLFPERLTPEFLQRQRHVLGSYNYSNQYQNEVIPEDEKRFKKQWIKNYKSLPSNTYRFGFIDPAIGQDKHHDYTGIVVVDVDTDNNWYVRLANRYRMTPTEIVGKMFQLQDEFKLQALGVEVVAYQEALLYILQEEMRRRSRIIPVTGITRNRISKNTRILGLVPRFEFGSIYLNQGLVDLEDELNHFPRSKFDDLLDALASIESVVFYPQKEVAKNNEPNPGHKDYERHHIKKLQSPKNRYSAGWDDENSDGY